MALGIDDKEKKPGGLQPSGPNQLQAGPTPLSQPPQQKKATGFVNLNKYMQANVGNKLGQAVGGGISGQAQQARTGLQQQQGQFQQQAQQGRVGTAQDVQQMQNVLQDPTKATEQDVNAFQKFRTQGYIGPQGLQDQEQLQSQAQQAGQMGQAIGSTGGRLGLLQRFLGGGQQYGAGSQRMDEMLLGRSAGQQLRDARRGATKTAADIQSGVEQAQQAGQNFATEANAFKEQVGKELGSRETGITDVLGRRIGEETAKKEQLGKDLASALQTGELTKEQADLLGLQEGQELYNTDISHFLKAGESPATMQNVASAQEMANMNALARLGGKQAFGKDEEAGSFMKNQYSMDKDTMMKKIAENKANYESAISPYQTGEAAYQGANAMLANFQKNADINRQMEALGERPGNLVSDPETGNVPTQEQIAANQKAQQEYDAKANALQSQMVANPADYGGLWSLINSVGRGGDEGTAKAFDMLMGDNQRQRAAELLRHVSTGQHQGYENIRGQYNPEKKLRFKQLAAMSNSINPSVRAGLGAP